MINNGLVKRYFTCSTNLMIGMVANSLMGDFFELIVKVP